MIDSHANEPEFIKQVLQGIADKSIAINDEYSVTVFAEYLVRVVALEQYASESEILKEALFSNVTKFSSLSFETIENLALLNLALKSHYQDIICRLFIDASETRSMRIDKVVTTLRYLFISDSVSSSDIRPVLDKIFECLDVCISSFVLEVARCIDDLEHILPRFTHEQHIRLKAIIDEMKETGMVRIDDKHEVLDDIVLSKPL